MADHVCILCGVVFSLIHQGLASLQHLDVRHNRLGNAGLSRLCAAATPHPTLTEWHFTWVAPYFDEPCTLAFADLLRDNCVLTTLPIDRLVPASPPRLRYLLLDALKLNVSLTSSQSSLLLPLPVRAACRQFAGLDCPVQVVERLVAAAAAAEGDGGSLLLDPRRLSPRDTWRLIGEGAFGQVFQAVLDPGGDAARDVCVKSITAAADQDDHGKSFFRELALIHELGAQEASALREWCVFAEHVVLPPATGSADTMWLVLPLMANGSVDTCEEDRLSVSTRLRILADVSLAVAELHERDVLHRDLARRQVLLDAENRARLCDWGLACRGAHAWQCDKFPIYDWAPELVAAALVGRHEPYTSASETWSFGVLMLETMLGANPFGFLFNAELEDPEQDVFATYRVIESAEAQEWPLVIDGQMSSESGLAVADRPLSGATTSVYYRKKHDRYQRGDGSRSGYAVPFVAQTASDGGYASPALVGAAVPAVSLPRVTQWWHDYMHLPTDSAGPDTRALNLLIHACCRWQSTQRPRMRFVAQLLACLAAETPRPLLPSIDVATVTEVLLLAQWQVLGITVAHRWSRQDAQFVMFDASQRLALQAVLPYYQTSTESLERNAANRTDSVHTVDRWNYLAILSEALGEVALALDSHQQVVNAQETSLGPQHPDVATSLNNLAGLLRSQGEYASARPLFERAEAITNARRGQ